MRSRNTVSITGFSGPDAMPLRNFAPTRTPSDGKTAATGYQAEVNRNPNVNTPRRERRSPTPANASAPTTEPAPAAPTSSPRLTAVPYTSFAYTGSATIATASSEFVSATVRTSTPSVRSRRRNAYPSQSSRRYELGGRTVAVAGLGTPNALADAETRKVAASIHSTFVGPVTAIRSP